jgi:hypothetical protein
MNSASSIYVRAGAAVVSGCLMLAASGCQHVIKVFGEGTASGSVVTTASVEAVRAAQVAPHTPHRRYAAMEMDLPAPALTYGPLYFEDPYEAVGDEDGPYAWRVEDGCYWFYGPGRFIVNAAFFPISVVVEPPWHLRTDGAG